MFAPKLHGLQQPKKAPVVTPIETTMSLNVTAVGKGLESYLDTVKTANPHIAFGTPAVESQQLDNSKRTAELDEMRDTLSKYDEEHPHTGPLHVYLLDGVGVATMDQDAQSSLRALVSHVLNCPHRTVAALLPEDSRVAKLEEISPSTMLRQLADTVLSTEGLTVLVGKQAFESFLANPEAHGNFKKATDGSLSVANESMANVLKEIVISVVALAATVGIVAAIGAGFVALGNGFQYLYGKVVGDEEDVNRAQAATEHTLKDMAKLVHETYANPAWVEKAKFTTGMVSGKEILAPLSDHGKLPEPRGHLIARINAHAQETLTVANWYVAHVGPWSKAATAIGKWILAEVKKTPEPDVDFILETADDRLEALGEPWLDIRVNTSHLLGDAEFRPFKDHAENQLYFVTDGEEGKDYQAGEVPALDAAGVASIAKVLLHALDTLEKAGKKFDAASDVLLDGESDFDVEYGTEGNTVWDEISDNDGPTMRAFYHHDRYNRFGYLEWSLMDQQLKIAKALHLWLSRSVKA